MAKAWMPLYIGDYFADTRHLSQGQHGAYLLLIMHYWQRGPIPANPAEYYCIACALDEQSRCNADAVLKQFFELSEVVYRHTRIDKELIKSKIGHEARLRAANARWDKQRTTKADAMHVQTAYGSSDCDCDSDCVVDSKEMEAKIREIASLHPKVRDVFNLPNDVATAIVEAIARDSWQVVWAGTKAFSEAVAKWPVSDRQFILAAPRFYRQSEYRANPKEWDRSSNGPQTKPSATVERVNRNREALAEAARSHIAARDGSDGRERESGTDSGTQRRMAASAASISSRSR